MPDLQSELFEQGSSYVRSKIAICFEAAVAALSLREQRAEPKISEEQFEKSLHSAHCYIPLDSKQRVVSEHDTSQRKKK